MGHIKEAFRIRQSPMARNHRRYFDTFDWRLFNRQRVLFLEDNGLYLQNLSKGKTEARVDCPSGTAPHFWWEIDDENLQQSLKPVLSIRALMLMTTIQRRIQAFRILNDDEKTVLIVNLETITPIQHEKQTGYFYGLRLESIRGYSREKREFIHFLKNLGIESPGTDLLTRAMENLDRHPGDYSSKIHVPLPPDSTAHEAVRAILNVLLNIIILNEEGIEADIDTEFLHDFRVAVRRTRSALTQIKDIFPPDETEYWKGAFAELGKSTNRLRDLDVYILDGEAYSSLLPESLGSGLEPLFKMLKTERRQEHRRVVRYLNSRPYHDLIDSWNHFLNRPVTDYEPGGDHAQIPINRLARTTIYKKFKKVVRMGKKIDETTPDKSLHQLRIECKKLRYLLEFFHSLFPKKEMAVLIGHLKKLQDNLGRFNDLSVQQNNLAAFLKQVNRNKAHSMNTAAALGGLITRLNQEQRLERQQFEERFSEFSASKNKRLFKKRFKDDTGIEAPA